MRLPYVSIAALAVAATAFTTAAPPPGRAASPVIQPGASLDFGGSFCTMNWVYDGPGAVYVGAAAHCTSGVGQVVSLATASLGTDIERIGTVAYVGTASGLDYCLIRLDARVLGQVRAAMAGHPAIPSGVAKPSQVKLGDRIQFSGHGVGFDETKATQQDREGVFSYFNGGYQFVFGPVTPGDSGGPVADITDHNAALGIVDTVGVDVATPHAVVGEGGVALYALLADANAHGLGIHLRTVR